MKRTLPFFFLLTLFALGLHAQPSSLNMTEVGRLTYAPKTLSDVWGYVDSSGTEWALVGVFDGESIVDLSDPANPVEQFFLPGPGTIWRDLKTWGPYAYVTNEASDGLRIIDLRDLPNTINYKDTVINGAQTIHNLWIDNGFIYLVGANASNGGIIILDANTDPWNPTYLGSYSATYVHDVYVRNDTAYAGEIYDGELTILDLSDPSNPVTLGSKTYTDAFTHNTWLNDAGDVCFTTDEVNGAYIYSWDVSDPQNITYQGQIRSSLSGGTASPHNGHVLDDFLVTSYYNDGVVVIDGSRPTNLVEVGHYDTSPLTGPGIGTGCWGAYPYLPSGIVLGTDVEEGLYVLQPSYPRACWLEGNVTDSLTGLSITGASVDIASLNLQTNSDNLGDYRTGTPTPGTYSATFSKFGYYPKTVQVTLSNGNLTIEDVVLSPAAQQQVEITVYDQQSGQVIPNAQVALENTGVEFTYTADANGQVRDTLPGGIYQVIAGDWGHQTQAVSFNFSPTQTSASVNLPFGYYDDFIFDYKWTTSATASQGLWELGEPLGTYWFGYPINPEEDLSNDFGTQCYVTGNQGQTPGDDDVSNGEVWLTSPTMNLENVWNPGISFWYWFVNAAGNNPNDTITVYVDNGLDTTEVFQYCCIPHGWDKVELRLSDFNITPTSTMNVIFKVGDYGTGNFIEVAIDKFQAGYYTTVGVEPPAPKDPFEFTAGPNPFRDGVTFRWKVEDLRFGEQLEVRVFDLQGREVARQVLDQTEGQVDLEWKGPGGMYLGVLQRNGEVISNLKLMKQQ